MTRSPARPASAVKPVLEDLEGRRLYASFATRINFAPIDAPSVKHYRIDYGAAYGRRANGLTYGWSSNKTDDASYAKSVYDNPRGDSHIDMSSNDTWSISVPNGYYKVRALMGDPTTLDGDYRINADGVPLVKGKPYPGFPFIEGQTTVLVTDNKLTVTSATRSENNRLASIMIASMPAPVAPPQGVGITWSRDNSVASPVARVEAAVVRLGTKVIVMGGFTEQYLNTTSRVDVLDTATGKWSRLADLPGPATHIAAATDGKYIYAAGGQTGPLLSDNLTSLVWRLNLSTNKWQRFGRLPAVRAGAQMQIINNELHVIGGDNATRVVSQATHYVLDLDKPSAGWTEAAPLPVPTDHHTSIVVDGQLYVLGGEVDHGTSYFTRGDFFRYDAKKNRWITLPSMPVGISHQEGATLTDGKRIIVIAGQVDVQQMTADVFSYNFATGVWEQHTSIPNPRKGGIAYLTGNTMHYFAGDDEAYGEPVWSYKGVIG